MMDREVVLSTKLMKSKPWGSSFHSRYRNTRPSSHITARPAPA